MRSPWGGRTYYSFNRGDSFAKRLGVGMLANIGVLRNTICQFFGVCPRTIGYILRVYKKDGIEGLRVYKQGPEGIEEELRQFVIKRYLELEGTRGYQRKILEAIEEKVEDGEFKKTICRSKL